MKVTVLGRWGAYPEAGEATAGYLLQTDKHNILLDCGSGVLAKLLYHVRQEYLDAVFISHFHYDHCADLGCLFYAAKISMGFQKRQKALPVYGPGITKRFPESAQAEYAVGIDTAPGAAVDLDGLKVTFFPTIHEEYNLAMRFDYKGKTLVYTGDLGPGTEISPFCSGADLLICETSHYASEKERSSGHLTTEEAGRLAQNSGVKALLLTHFPHIGDIQKMPEEAARVFSGKVYQAEINKTFKI